MRRPDGIGSGRELSTAGLGGIVTIVAAMWILDRVGAVELERLFGYWPFLLLVLGAALLLGPRAGLLLIAAGGLILFLRLDSVSLVEAWPLVLVAAGSILVWRSFGRK